MSLKNKLNRLKPHIKSGVEKPKAEPVKAEEAPEIPYLDVWQQEQVSPFYFDGQYCLVREVSYPLDQQHGHYQFGDLLEAVTLWNKEQTKHPLSAVGHSPADLVFFDTETTGLGGGAGNTIFLLGHASISGNSLKLKQHILPNPGAEVALYQSFLMNADYTTLVTYNGKAFDWPQVKTRHTLVRDHVPKLPSYGHFDLYHAARRLWKHKIERMKLSIVEQEVLGLERKDDIPGFLAPMIYFDFLERKNPEGLIGVIKHNETDILSLLTLYTHLTFQILGRDRTQTSRETFEVGRWFSYLGESDKAKQTFSGLLDEGNEEAISAKHALAFEYKKHKEWQKAVELWIESAAKGTKKQRKEACIELAKHYEHREKNLELAMKYCSLAEEIHREEKSTTKKDMIFTIELEKRIQRISRKEFPGQAQNSPK
ncbi:MULTISPECIES: ribonuclease H-like domain-containing protein [Mesobacillus]|uniref:ribonuclease H-like domain-containing protein n=1 Tax=Mesobacillus TaxID=2675231 RepID=UPI00177F1B12|nr:MULTISPECIES: ribonuclease H-like domain-containing protein [Mesobacillus]MCM3571617.1 ribonuclease H-like domain-containing protein [Mesobacillus subterraneus]UYZ20530.1 ribonuclease H-like domain-containing protein [Mesobacillus jeotgali]